MASTIPIAFVSGVDAVQIGLVASLNNPGGNVTGVSFLATSLGPKKLEMLRALVPTAAVIGMLINTNIALAKIQIAEVEGAGRMLGLQIHVVHASAERDFDAAFASLAAVRAGGLVIGADAFLNSRRDQLVERAAHHSIPAIYPWREAVTAGGLMSYGASLTEAYRQAGLYAGKILNGDKPADLPVIQATKVDLVINLRTAKALGLTVPLPLLALRRRGDRVMNRLGGTPMQRRNFLKAIASSAGAWPLRAAAQGQQRVYRIAVVHPVDPTADMNENGESPFYRSLFLELHRLGYFEGKNIQVERRSGEGRTERYAEVARNLVDLRLSAK
jgi:hypothetical protein